MGGTSTIFALSSASGRAGVAVVRVSGPAAARVLADMAGPLAAPRHAAVRTLRHPVSGEAIDRALVLWLPGPGSFTGEDVAELQVHGSRAVIRATLDALAGIEGCRLAEPGEFALRAFQNGRIDLAEAEGLADLIEAETEAQRRQALAQACGSLSGLYEGWRTRLIEAAALVEAAIDFSDEADVADDVLSRARVMVEGLSVAVNAHLDDGRRGEILREGFRVVLAGPPNAGKSSLLNALARREAAIVSEEAGTTRDAIEVRLDLAGLPIVVTDTAGLREAEGTVEREGIRRTLVHARQADLVIWLMDGAVASPVLPPADLTADPARLLTVWNKADLWPSWPRDNDGCLRLSALTGAGLVDVTGRIATIAKERLAAGEVGDVTRGTAIITQARHRRLVEDCAAGLEAFLSGATRDIELRAEDLRASANALGRITGRIDIEDILDQVFSRFCIGK